MPGIRPIKTYGETLLGEQAPAQQFAICFCMTELLQKFSKFYQKAGWLDLCFEAHFYIIVE